MPASNGSGSVLLDARGISKTFSGTCVLSQMNIRVRSGEVHSLIGENGSGKSTFIKVLAGYHRPDHGGQLHLGGSEVNLPVSPRNAANHGMCFLHQDLGLVPTMSVLENLAVGRGYFVGRLFGIRWARERAWVQGLIDEYGLPATPDTPIAALSEIDRAVVAILRALEQLRKHHYEGVIVLDEPTAFLPRREVGRVFAAIRSAVAKGAGALFVSHRLDEVMSISDTVSVLRNGNLVGTVPKSEVDERELIRMMLGRYVDQLYPDVASKPREDVVLRIAGLSGEQVAGASFKVHAGEVVGVTGLLGMGQDELPYLVSGAVRPSAGELSVNGAAVDPGDPRKALLSGIALLPADRKSQSSLQAATVGENVSLPVLRNYWRGGRLRHAEEERDIRALLERYDVRPPDPVRPLKSLSGGNQQKALLAKWIQMAPPVLVLHEPTQGVDIGARSQIFGFLTELTQSGTAVLMCSSEYAELANLCDRVLVFRDGEIASELSGDAVTEDSILRELYVGARDAARS